MLAEMPLAHGKACVEILATPEHGLCLRLVDASGRPAGRSKTLGRYEAKAFVAAYEAAPSLEARRSLVWARLGYGTRDTRPVCATLGHPGTPGGFCSGRVPAPHR